jgi:hypothetical protein
MFKKSNQLVTCLMTLTFAGCATKEDVDLNEGSTEQAVASGDGFILTRIPIPYQPNFGSLSGLAYDASNDTWWTHDDNRSGTVTYPTIFNFRVHTDHVEILSEMPLRDEAGNNVVASPSNTTPTNTTGLDPEGIIIAPDGTFWMIDEENETFLHVSREGQILSRHYAPGFRGSNSPTPDAGAATRVRGAGFEGVALSPDGNTVYGGHQTALATFPTGEADVTFIAALHVPTNTWRTYKVPLDPVSMYDYTGAPPTPAPRMGLHDLFFDGYDAQGREQLIWMERDNKRDAFARDKRVYRVTLPDYATYDNSVLSKELVVDLVAWGYQLEKPEGLVRRGNKYYIVNDNVQTASDPMEFTIVERVPAWSASTVYTAGDLVWSNGSAWKASWWTQNQQPGNPTGPWQEIVTAADGTAVWTASRIFVANDVALYNGQKYRAKWWTRNQAPGNQWGPWELVP